MRHSVAALLHLVLWTLSFAVPASATLIVAYVGPGELVLASDAAVIHLDGHKLPEPRCKTPVLAGRMVFALSGVSEYDEPRFDALALAREVTAASRSPEDAARRYSARAAVLLRRVWEADRRLAPRKAEGRSHDSGSSVHHFLFVGADAKGRLALVAGEVVLHPGHDDVTTTLLPSVILTRSTPAQILSLGSVVPDTERVQALVQRDGPAGGVGAAVEEQVRRAPAQLGSPVAVLQVTAAGAFTWVRGGVCAEDGAAGTLFGPKRP